MIILGIDPGLAIVGYGVIEFKNNRFKTIAYGSIETPAHTPVEERLKTIYEDLDTIIKMYRPDDIAIEELFFNTNQKTGIIVAEARGVILLSCNLAGIPIFEYTPLQIKSAVAGYGRAEKNQVIEMVTHFLGLKEKPKPDDTADALAAAICHAHTGTSRLAQYYNRPTTMAGKIGQTGKGSRSAIAEKLGGYNADVIDGKNLEK